MRHRIKIYIIDDHHIVRDGLKALFKEEDNIELVGECDGQIDIPSFIDADPDIVLMDISLGNQSGIDLTRQLLSAKADTRIIILSMLSSEEVVLSATEAGARGYLPKSTSKDEMMKAIAEVYLGNTYFHSEIAGIMIAGMLERKKKPEKDSPCIDCLSKREIQIIEMFARGFTNQEIADQLFISIRTVESHKTHIMQKLNFRSSVEMVKFAIRHKLIEIG
ncbi:MAG: response regulator transcription factor [Bacteroidales bacterium]